jgi:hypothetical protein
MSETTRPPDTEPRGADGLIDQLSAEYKILQEKLDKIGAFRFTVKGWSVTLVIGSIVAVSANRQVSPHLLWFLLLFVWVFFWVESKQDRLSRVYGKRIFQLEKHIYTVLRSSTDKSLIAKVGGAPLIANAIRSDRRSEQSPTRRTQLVQWAADSDNGFYLFQSAIIVAAFGILQFRSPARPRSIGRRDHYSAARVVRSDNAVNRNCP